MCSSEMLSCLCQAIGQAEGLAPLERICLFSHGEDETKLHVAKWKKENGQIKEPDLAPNRRCRGEIRQ